jgi:hypothetical protein
MKLLRGLFTVAALATLGLFARRAQAATCPADTAELAGLDSEVRLRFLADTFDREIRNVDIWSWTWASVYGAAAVTQAAIIPVVSDHGVRTDLTVGAISASVGAVTLFGLPLAITLPLRSVRREW